MDLTWEAPSNCPQRDAVQARIRALAGPALRKAGPLRAEGRIERVDRGYRLRLIVRDKGEVRERTMEASSCVDLAGAAAVALGLLLRQGPPAAERPDGSGAVGSGGEEVDGKPPRPGADGGEDAPRPSDVSATPRDATPGDDATPEDDASTSQRPSDSQDAASGNESLGLILRAPLATLDVGPFPKPSFGVGGGIGIRTREWRFVLGAHVQPRQAWLMPGSAGAGAQVGRWHAELSGCRGWETGRLGFAPCLALGLDRVWARGTGPVVSARSQHSLGLVLGAAGAAHLQVVESLAAFISVGMELAVSRPRLVVDGRGQIGQLDRVQFFTRVGPEWIF